MTTPAAISSEITSARPTVQITVKTKGPWTAADEGAVKLKRTKDHPDWDVTALWGKKAVEPRRMPERLLTPRGKQDGTSKKYDWRPHWDFADEGMVTNDLEIYGVLRAEHRFKQWGYQKLNSKMGNHGIDSLFKKGTEFALCESKAGGSTDAVKHYLSYLQMHRDEEHSEGNWELVRRRKDMVTARLKGGGIKGIVPQPSTGATFPEQYTETKILEMTEMWVDRKISEMITGGGRLRRSAQQLRRSLKRGRAFRYFNFYAAKPLYALPGVYVIDRCRAAEFAATDAQKSPTEKIYDWPDNGSRLERELLWLDVHDPFLELEQANEDDYWNDVAAITGPIGV